MLEFRPETRTDLRSFLAIITLLMITGVLAALASGCSGRSAGGGWVHETSTTGAITTVRTMSGSVWGGPGELVEEVSIGVTEGADAYLFGSVRGLWSTADLILVVDLQAPAVRVYDSEGMHLYDIGGEGSGPGEFRRPRSVAVNPVDGMVYVRDGNQGRLNRYTISGEYIDAWPILSGMSTGRQLVMTDDGKVHTPTIRIDTATGLLDMGYMLTGPDGAVGDTVWAPEYEFDDWIVEARTEDGQIHIDNVPFSPRNVWTLCPDGTVAGGVSDHYRFDLFHPDGRKTVVEMNWDRVPVDPAEARWYRARTTAELRTTLPGWAWNGREIPRYKPAYDELFPDRSGRIWLQRQGPGAHLVDGIDDPDDRAEFTTHPAWKETYTFDVFDLEGRYLGPVDAPEGFQFITDPFIEDDMVIALVQDNDGVQYVKRYRLVLPEGAGE